MGLNDTPGAERVHIGFFGRRNAGKSSVVNAVTGQEVALVSAVRGTTTDPVSKAMELLPMGPVMIIDTPGFDDEGALGTERVRRTKQVLNRTDVAVLVVDAAAGLTDCDRELTAIFRGNDIRSVTLLRMEVPCCGGLEHAVKTALAACGKDIPLTVQVVNIDGTLA